MKDLHLKACLLPILLLSLISAGCVATGEGRGRRSLLQAYSEGRGEGASAVREKAAVELTLKQAYGYTKPYVPVLEYPRVQRIWIPERAAADGSLISGHWVYIILSPPQWMQVNEQERGIEFPTIIPFKGRNAQK